MYYTGTLKQDTPGRPCEVNVPEKQKANKQMKNKTVKEFTWVID